MTFTFKLSKRLALTFAAVSGLLWGCTDVPSDTTSTPIAFDPPAAVGDTLFSEGFELGVGLPGWDDNFRPQAKTVVGAAARTGSLGLRVTFSPTVNGGVLSKFVARGDRVYFRAAVRFPATWTGGTGFLTLRAAPAANPWGGFGTAGVCPSGSTWAVTGLTTTTPNLDLRFNSSYVGMAPVSAGFCQANAGLSGPSTATYSAPLAVSKGHWHIVEMEAQLNTVGLADGWQRVWLDGRLTGQWNGLTFRTSGEIQWNAVSLDLASAGVTQTQTLDIDDVLVLRQQPTAAVAVATVQVAPATLTLATGATSALTATLRDAAGNTLTGRAVAWSSSNPAVGSVSSSGLVTALTAGSATITATSEGRTGSSVVTVTAPPPPSQVLLSEGFDDTQFASRGWYDFAGTPVVTTADRHSGAGALQLQWSAGSTKPPMKVMRRLFAETDRLYVSYWVKYSSNYVGSGRAYHPHEFNVLSNQDQSYDGLTYNYLNAYIEQNYQNGGIPRVSIQDSRMIDINRIGVNLTGVTENRSIGGCNGSPDGSTLTSCYQSTPTQWYNIREFNAPAVAFRPTAGTDYKNNWNRVEVELQLNSVVNGIGQANGVLRYWLNGSLKIERTNVLYRTGANPGIKFRQFVLSPFIGDGSPVAQTMWVDDLVLATSRDGGPPIPPPPGPPPPAPAPVATVSVTPASATVATGAATQLTAVTRDAAGATLTGRTITWTTSQSGVATVVNGLVTGRGTGQATITATSEGRTGSATVTVPAPAAVATVQVSPTSASVGTAGSQQFTATARDAGGNVLIGRPVTWTTSNLLVATVTPSGLAVGLVPGTVTVRANIEGVTGSGTLTVTLTPPIGGVPELPSGYSLRATHAGSPLVPSGWLTSGAGTSGVSLFDDVLAPVSPNQVMRVNFPAGYADGNAPVRLEYPGTSGARQMFYTYWFKYNSSFQGHDSNVNKHIFVFGQNGSVLVYSELRFSGNESQGHMDFQFQGGMGAPTYDRRLVEHFGGNQLRIAKDQWHRVSLELIEGSGNGVVRAWVDGVKVAEITNANFATGIGVVKIDPTWGGNSGDRMAQAGYIYFDEVRIHTK